MPVIWILESPHEDGMVISRTLIGNFAIRCLASLSSFERICRIEKDRSPDIVIINCRHFKDDILDMDRRIGKKLENAFRLFIGSSNEVFTDMGSQCALFSFKHLATDLVSTVKRISREIHQAQSSLLNYKDIELNVHEFSIRIQPLETFESLPNREFKLARLFINNPNKCFSREELRQLIWDGAAVASRTIDSQISRLRKRLGASEAAIESIYGGGYRLT